MSQPLTTLTPGYNGMYNEMNLAENKMTFQGHHPNTEVFYDKTVKSKLKIEEEGNEKNPCCKKQVDPCCNNNMMGAGWKWLGMLILWFIILTVLFWLIYYSLKPSFVLQNGTTNIDTSKVLLAAVVTALIVIIIIWLIKVAIQFRNYV